MNLFLHTHLLKSFVFVDKAEDVDLMVERMDEQMKQLTKAYREELTQIEVCFQ